MDEYTGQVVKGQPEVQGDLQCAALVKLRKGVYRHCRRTPEFSTTLKNNRGYSVMMCFTHINADEVVLAVGVF